MFIKSVTAPGFRCLAKVSLPRTFILLIGLVLLSVNVQAQGDLFITPKRLIFEGQQRAQEITLANIGKDTARYEVSWMQIRLKDDGRFEQIEQPDSGQYFADKFLRIFPRSVTLAPQETQIVKVQLYRKDKLITGEYRSHLYFRAVPAEKTKETKTDDSDEKAVSIKITPIFGISIPVIVRNGLLSSSLSLSELSITKDKNLLPVLNLTLSRSGNKSIYGDLEIFHISAGGKKTQAGLVKGLAVYTPNQLRHIQVKLDPALGTALHSGKILVTFNTVPATNVKTQVTSELTLK